MKVLRITRDNLSQYADTALAFEGHIELEAELDYVSFKSLSAKGYIYAKAGTGIEAGEGISVKLRIFAGIILRRKPTPEEMTIKCQRLLSGEVAYGTLIETGNKQ